MFGLREPFEENFKPLLKLPNFASFSADRQHNLDPFEDRMRSFFLAQSLPKNEIDMIRVIEITAPLSFFVHFSNCTDSDSVWGVGCQRESFAAKGAKYFSYRRSRTLWGWQRSLRFSVVFVCNTKVFSALWPVQRSQPTQSVTLLLTCLDRTRTMMILLLGARGMTAAWTTTTATTKAV